MNTHELLAQAKKSLQAQGQCVPTLTVEFCEDGKEPIMQSIGLVGFPERTELQRHILHNLGHQIAEMHPAKSIACLCLFMQLAKVVEHDTNKPPDACDERFEALIMQTLSVFAPSRNAMPLIRQSATVIEIIRSGAGVDFLPRKEGEIDDGVLESFVEGVACEKAGAQKIVLTQELLKKSEKAGKGHE